MKPLELPKAPKGESLTNIDLTKLGVKHPGCGGNLMIEGSGRARLGLSPVTHYFDIYGRYLTTLHGTEGLFRDT